MTLILNERACCEQLLPCIQHLGAKSAARLTPDCDRHDAPPNVYGDQLRREASSAASSSWIVTIPPTDDPVACPAHRRSDRAHAQADRTGPESCNELTRARTTVGPHRFSQHRSPTTKNTEHSPCLAVDRGQALLLVARNDALNGGCSACSPPAITRREVDRKTCRRRSPDQSNVFDDQLRCAASSAALSSWTAMITSNLQRQQS